MIKDKDKVLDLFEKCLTQGRSEWGEVHRDYVEDKKFILLGEQLTTKEKERLKGRPMFIINKLIQFVKKVTNEMRQTNIASKVSPVDSGADINKAKVRQEAIRGIERISNARFAYQYAGEDAVTGGLGAFRVNTVYVSDKSDQQTIEVKRIRDASTVYCSPCNEPDYSDATWWIIENKTNALEKDTPEYNRMNEYRFTDKIDSEKWGTKDVPFEYEFWYREEIPDELYQFKTGRYVFKSQVDPNASDDLFRLKDGKKTLRKTTRKQWCVYKLKARDYAEEPKKWPGKYAGICLVNGREVWVDGKRKMLSLCRYSKESQRMYNYARQEMARRLGMSPKAMWLIAIESIPEKFMGLWQEAHKKTLGMLPWQAKDKNGNPNPKPEIPQTTPIDQSLVSETMNTDAELKDTTGIQNENLGQRSNAASGKAILAKQREGDVNTFDYQDNLAISVQHANKIINDLIPKIIDTPRQVRLVGDDEKERVVMANADYEDPKTGKENKDYYFSEEEEYDIVTTVGPSYDSQRQQNAEAIRELMGQSESAAQVLPPFYVQSLDFPGNEKAAEMLIETLPPNLKKLYKEDGEDGPEMPPEAMKAMQENLHIKAEMQKLLKEFENLKTDKSIEAAKLKEEKRKNDREFDLERFKAVTERAAKLGQVRNQQEKIEQDGDIALLKAEKEFEKEVSQPEQAVET